ncbi:helix-turn-helix domain-containing protein [Arthrobacter echini]|uniref:helix-turn-helix domain-containing protein n=1 Tax=Arthrobacter echini TaxID=1529066 RepID=UPI0021CC5178|nr:helix-turn-helix domain-containing protein [Arthrobacter echini]
MGCPGCGVVAVGRGRRRRALHDVPGVSRVRVIWRQRIWRCADTDCEKGAFIEQLPSLVPARGSITTRAVTWAIGQLRREHATIAGLARQLGTSWKTVWRAVVQCRSRAVVERIILVVVGIGLRVPRVPRVPRDHRETVPRSGSVRLGSPMRLRSPMRRLKTQSDMGRRRSQASRRLAPSTFPSVEARGLEPRTPCVQSNSERAYGSRAGALTSYPGSQTLFHDGTPLRRHRT